ncbi:MAG: hypothetical protein LUI07_10475 [Lachnospiraceae bacterium]|nr:hypothetical protein [Lachnospiraceae bacterium]
MPFAGTRIDENKTGTGITGLSAKSFAASGRKGRIYERNREVTDIWIRFRRGYLKK